MAKSTNTKAAAASPARADVARRPNVAEALEGVRQFHAVGKGDAAPAQWNHQMRLEAKKFAECYSKKKLRDLCADAERHNFPLCVSHVRCLLTLGGPDRKQLARALIDGRWGKLRLDAEIRRRIGNRRKPGGGRKPVPPADAAGAYLGVIKVCGQWGRFYDALGGPRTAGSPGGARAASGLWRKLSPAVREAAEAAGEAMRRLRDAADKADEPRRAKLPGGDRRKPLERGTRAAGPSVGPAGNRPAGGRDTPRRAPQARGNRVSGKERRKRP